MRQRRMLSSGIGLAALVLLLVAWCTCGVRRAEGSSAAHHNAATAGRAGAGAEPAEPATAPERDAQPADGGRVNITISRETTRIFGPVRDDGRVDYVAYLNTLYGRGVTSENNAAVELLHAMGPKGFLSAQEQPQTYRLLGIDPLPAEGDYFVDLETYAETAPADLLPEVPQPHPQTRARIEALEAKVAQAEQRILGSPEAPQGGKPMHLDWDALQRDSAELARLREKAPDWETVLDRRLEAAQEAPWKAEAYPLIAAWLDANARALGRAVAAANRPRYYRPMLSDTDPPQMVDAIIPSLARARRLSAALLARMMRRAGAGDFAAARADLLAAHRLARHIGSGPTLIDRLVGMAHEGQATKAGAALATAGVLPATQARRLVRDLRTLRPLPGIAEVMDRAERFGALDLLQTFARGRPGRPRQMLDRLQAGYLRRMDWDPILRRFNVAYDNMVAGFRERTHAARRRALRNVEEDVEHLAAIAGVPQGGDNPFGLMTGVLLNPLSTSDKIAAAMLSIFMPSVAKAGELHTRVVMRGELEKVAFALAAHKAETGEYPAKLSALAPRPLPAVPKDAFTGEPLHYERTDAGGYRLYSVGMNATDDGGVWEAGDDEKDDLVVEGK